MSESKPAQCQGIPEAIPELFTKFENTATSSQDALLIMAIESELRRAGLKWYDLGNLLRFQIVAQKRANIMGVVNACKSHPNLHRLNNWCQEFLASLGHQKKLLTDKQLACLQSIIDSLNMPEAEWLAKEKANGSGYHASNHVGELHS